MIQKFFSAISDGIQNQLLLIHLTILFRIILSAILAFIPGLERELTGKVAGLRTHILVSLGACVFTILSIYGFKMHEAVGIIGTNDPARIAAQIITGIGFIGAGTVMRHGGSVSGITTAATLWLCAGIGMSCGCGQYVTAIIASCVTLFVLILIRKYEKTFLASRKKNYHQYAICLHSKIEDCEILENIFAMNFHKTYKFNKKLLHNDGLSLSAIISTKKTLKEINNIFKSVSNLVSLEVSEYYD